MADLNPSMGPPLTEEELQILHSLSTRLERQLAVQIATRNAATPVTQVDLQRIRSGVPRMRDRHIYVRGAPSFVNWVKIPDSIHPILYDNLKMHYDYVTEVQSIVFETLRQAYTNLVIDSPTDSGKTLSYFIPAIHRCISDLQSANVETQDSARHHTVRNDSVHPKVIVLIPVRALALIALGIGKFLVQGSAVRLAGVLSHVSYHDQCRILLEGADIIVATPACLNYYIDKGVINLSEVQCVVQSDAARLVECFKPELDEFLYRLSLNNSTYKTLFLVESLNSTTELALHAQLRVGDLQPLRLTAVPRVISRGQ